MQPSLPAAASSCIINHLLPPTTLLYIAPICHTPSLHDTTLPCIPPPAYRLTAADTVQPLLDSEMTESTPRAHSGTLSLTLHQARHLPSASAHHHMSPVATIQLPHCSHLFTTPVAVNGDTRPTWNAEFDLNVTNAADPDSVHFTVWSDATQRQAIGDMRLTMKEVHRYGRRHDEDDSEPRWFKLTKDGISAGELQMAMAWHKKANSEAGKRERRHGRFVVSDTEDSDSSTASDSDERIQRDDLPTLQTSQSGSDNSEAGSHRSISGTRSTDDDSSQGSGSSADTREKILDRRSSTASTASTATPSSSPSPASNDSIPSSASSPSISSLIRQPSPVHSPLPDVETFTHHPDRHISSFLPSTSGVPPLHSSGRHGLLYDDTTSFDDRNFLQHNAQFSSICQIKVWSRDYIHGLQFTYVVNGEHVNTPAYLGRVHTTQNTLKIHHSDGEYIVGITGTYKEWLETLTVITNRRSHTFGGNVDNRVEKWAPAGTKVKPTTFTCEVPPGHRVVGFEGGYGVHVHNIGVFYQPVSEADTKRKGKMCSLLGKLKKKLSSNKLVDSASPRASPRAGQVAA